MTPSEKQHLLVDFNNTTVEWGNLVPTVQTLFEERAAKTPQQIAVEFEGQPLTYAELNQQANQLACYLIDKGVKPDVLVAICVERSLEMVVGLLGILKAGGAYVPIDPAYPPKRQAFMLEDSGAALLLTQESLLAEMPAHPAEVVCLDRDWPQVVQAFEKLAREPWENPKPALDENHLAYVIYTSGSTGTPKGVQIPHGALSNFLLSMGQTFPLTTDDVFLAVTTLSFDIAALELYLPLIRGAKLVVTPREVVMDGSQLLNRLHETQTTIIQATPATWWVLLEAGWKGSPTLKILCGGEAMPSSLAYELLDCGQGLWNLYGPTETTIWSSYYSFPADTGIVEKIPLGRPLANTQLYVLDSHRRLAPPGSPGELHISGAGLARGYLKRPELTKEKFVANPFNPNPEARLYKTGDLVRFRYQGEAASIEIEFLGRLDHQVKVRGFRIELGEIEKHLMALESIKESVVLTKADDHGNQSLVAYVICETVTLDAQQIKQALSAHLPDYMIPSAYFPLEAFPLTPNGKIDKTALSKMSTALLFNQAYVAPRNETEEQLVALFRRVLNLESTEGRSVGVYDNFFELGGHSLLVTRLILQIRQQFGITLPFQLFFQEPTVSFVADAIGVTAQPEVDAADDEIEEISF